VRRADAWASFRIDSEQSELGRDAYLLLGEFRVHRPATAVRGGRDAGLDLSTVSRQVAALEAAGLVSRTGDPTITVAPHRGDAGW